jgi:hypothetical protein
VFDAGLIGLNFASGLLKNLEPSGPTLIEPLKKLLLLENFVDIV